MIAVTTTGCVGIFLFGVIVGGLAALCWVAYYDRKRDYTPIPSLPAVESLSVDAHEMALAMNSDRGLVDVPAGQQ